MNNVGTHHTYICHMMHHAWAYILFHISIKPIPFWHPGPCHLQHPRATSAGKPRCSHWKRHPSDDGLRTSDSFGFKARARQEVKSLLLGWMIWMIWMEDSGRLFFGGERPDEIKGNRMVSRRSWDGKGTIVNGAVFLGTWHLLMSYFLRFVSFTWRQLGIRLHSDVQSFVCLFV